MRAATIRDGEILARGAPRPGARCGRGARACTRGRAQRGRHDAAARAVSGAPRLAAGHSRHGACRRGTGARPPSASPRFKRGDRVMAIVGGGGQAELAVVHERQLMPVPAALDWPAAGGLPETFTTAHDALFTQAGLRPGERSARARRRRWRRHGCDPARESHGRARHGDRAPRPSRAQRWPRWAPRPSRLRALPSTARSM